LGFNVTLLIKEMPHLLLSHENRN